jgi:hypothetical protein
MQTWAEGRLGKPQVEQFIDFFEVNGRQDELPFPRSASVPQEAEQMQLRADGSKSTRPSQY